MDERGLGMIGSLIVGVIGSFLGGYLFRVVGLSYESVIGSFVTTLTGAVLILVLLKFVRRF